MLRLILGFLIIVAAALVVVFYEGSEQSVYRCALSPTASRAAPQTLFMKLDRYRWFIVWRNSDGMVSYEAPNQSGGLFTRVKKVGDYLQFYDDQGSLQGQFSTTSNSLVLNLPNNNKFEGACTRTK